MNKSICRISYLATKHRSWKIRKRNRKRILELVDKLIRKNQIKESFNIVNTIYRIFPVTHENDKFCADIAYKIVNSCQTNFHLLAASIIANYYCNIDIDNCKLTDVTKISDADTILPFTTFDAPCIGPDPMTVLPITRR